ncbi:hypothetical protein PR048_025080 [Dryococelus australis]|uniref:Uncharacterized protein n=1 Tax=Dryococelus australis TaxID=614101 RepID=A0ABQ9GQE8_9NEOP|nr:hypothetical protein PR048_025080 [Dryococelus australis]
MSAANYCFYLKAFKEHFSLSFGEPRVDTCGTCEELDVRLRSPFLNQTAKKVAEAEKCVRLHRTKKFTAKIKEISDAVKVDNAGDLGAICIDYMQNLQLPCIPVQENAVRSSKLFRYIDHYLPIRGHSFLPCDRVFAVLKIKKNWKYDRIPSAFLSSSNDGLSILRGLCCHKSPMAYLFLETRKQASS